MPNFSEQDITFLKKLKSQGVGAEDALSRLDAVKSQMSQQSQQPTPTDQGSTPPDISQPSENIMPTEPPQPEQPPKPNIDPNKPWWQKAVDAAAQNSVMMDFSGLAGDSQKGEGIRNFNANAAASALDTLSNTNSFLAKNLSPLSAITPNAAVDFVDKGVKDFTGGVRGRSFKENQADEGSFSSVTGDITGQVLGSIPAMGAAGKVAQGLGWGAKTLEKAPAISKLAGFLGRSGLESAASSAAMEGRAPTSGELATGVGVNALFGAPGAALNKFRKYRAQIEGISEKGIQALSDPKNFSTAKKYIEQAKASLKDPDKITPLTQVGKEVKDDFKSSLLPEYKKTGKQIGDIIDAASGGAPGGVSGRLLGQGKKLIPLDRAKQKIVDTLEKFSVLIKENGELDLSNTPFASNSAAKEQIESLGKWLSQGKVTPKILHNKIQDLAKVLKFKGSDIRSIGQAQKPMQDVYTVLREELFNAVPQVKPAFQRNAALAGAKQYFENTTKNTKNLATITKNLNNPEKTEELTKAMEVLSGVTGKNYTNKSVLANAVTSSLKDVAGGGSIKDNVIKAILKPKESAAKGLIKAAQGLGIFGGRQGAANNIVTRNATRNLLQKFMSTFNGQQAGS